MAFPHTLTYKHWHLQVVQRLHWKVSVYITRKQQQGTKRGLPPLSFSLAELPAFSIWGGFREANPALLWKLARAQAGGQKKLSLSYSLFKTRAGKALKQSTGACGNVYSTPERQKQKAVLFVFFSQSFESFSCSNVPEEPDHNNSVLNGVTLH